MIIKIKEINQQQLVNENQIYPVVAYRVNSNQKKEYRIFDEGNSFMWIIDGVEILSNDESKYYECMVNDEIWYLYNLLDQDFFLNFYLEEDDFECILKQLKEALKKIVMQDLSTQEIMHAISQTDVKSDYFPLLIDCFFSIASIKEINENMRYFATICEQLYENDIKRIVDYVELIDSEEVKYFFECISECYNISDDLMNQVYSYLYK